MVESRTYALTVDASAVAASIEAGIRAATAFSGVLGTVASGITEANRKVALFGTGMNAAFNSVTRSVAPATAELNKIVRQIDDLSSKKGKLGDFQVSDSMARMVSGLSPQAQKYIGLMSDLRKAEAEYAGAVTKEKAGGPVVSPEATQALRTLRDEVYKTQTAIQDAADERVRADEAWDERARDSEANAAMIAAAEEDASHRKIAAWDAEQRDREATSAMIIADEKATAEAAQRVANENERLASTYARLTASVDPAIATQQRYDKALADLRLSASAAGVSAEQLAVDEAKLTAALSPAAIKAKEEADAIDRIAAAVTPAEARIRALAEDQLLVNKAFAAGKINASHQRELTSGIEASTRALQAQTVAARNQKGLLGLSASQRAALFPQGVDVVQGLFMGQTPGMIAAQQGGQIIQAISGNGGEGLSAISKGMIGLGAAVVGVAVVAGTAAAAMLSYQSSIREVDRAVQAAGSGFGFTRDQLESIATTGAETAGISVSSAREMESAFIGTGKIGADTMEKLIASSRDYAAMTGQTSDEALKDLVSMFSDPAKGAETLATKYNALSGEQLRNITILAEAGNYQKAGALLVDALAAKVSGATEKTSGWSRGWTSFGTAASDALDAAGKKIDSFVSGTSSISENITKLTKDLEEASKKLAEAQARKTPETWKEYTDNQLEESRKKYLGEVEARGDMFSISDDDIANNEKLAKKSSDALDAIDDLNKGLSEEAISLKNLTETGYSLAVERNAAVVRKQTAEMMSAREAAKTFSRELEKPLAPFRGLSTELKSVGDELDVLRAKMKNPFLVEMVGDEDALKRYESALTLMKADLEQANAAGYLTVDDAKTDSRAAIEAKYLGQYTAAAESAKTAELAYVDAFGTRTDAMTRALRASQSVTQTIVNQAKTLVDAIKGIRDETALLSVPAGLERDIARFKQQYRGALSSASTVDFVAGNEEFDATATYTGKNRYAVGYGATAIGGRAVQPGDTISREDAASVLSANVAEAESAAKSMITSALNSNQWKAVVDQIYQFGAGAFADSALRAHINAGDFDAAAKDFLDWNKIANRQGNLEFSQGVQNRSNRRSAVFATPTVDDASGAISDRNAAQVAEEARQLDLTTRLERLKTEASKSLTDQQMRLADATRIGSDAQKLLSTTGKATTDAFLGLVEGGMSATDAFAALEARGVKIPDAVKAMDASMRGSALTDYAKSVNDLVRSLTLQEQAQLRTAAAAGLGEAAGRAAEYANSEATAAASLGDGGAVAQRLANERAEYVKLTAIRNEFTRGIDQQIAANDRLSAAYGVSDKAIEDAQRHNEAYTQTLKEVKEGEAGWTTALAANIKKLEERDLSKVRADMAAYEQALRHSNQDLDVQRAAAGLSEDASAELNARYASLKAQNLTIEGYQRLGGADKKHADDLMDQAALLDKNQRAVTRYTAAWEEIGNSLTNVFDTIGQSLVDAIVQGQNATINWGTISKSVLSSILTTLAKMAMVDFSKVIGLNTGNASGLSDIISGTSSNSGSSSNLSSLSKLTSSDSLPSWWNSELWSGTQVNTGVPYGSAGGSGSVVGGSGTTWGDVATGAGVALNGYNAISSFSNGQYGSGVGSTLSAGLGIASLAGYSLGPIGIIAQAALPIVGSLFDGLFGSSKPSAKSQTTEWDASTGVYSSYGMTGKKYSSENMQASQSLATSAAQLSSTIEALVSGTQLTGKLGVTVDDRSGIIARAYGAESTFDKGDTAGALKWFAAQFGKKLEEGLASSDITAQVADNLTKVIDRGVLDGTDQFVKDMQLAATDFSEAFDDFGKASVDQVATDITTLTTSFTTMKTRAETLGLALDGLSDSYAVAADRMIDAAIRTAQSRTYIDSALSIRSTFEAVGVQLLSAGQDGSKAVSLYAAQMSALVNGLDIDQLNDMAAALANIDAQAAEWASTRAAQLAQAERDTATDPYGDLAERQKAAMLSLSQITQAEYDQYELRKKHLAELKDVTDSVVRAQILQTQALEDQALAYKQAEAAAEALASSGGSIRSWIDKVTATASTAVSPTQAYTTAQSQFARDLALARGNDSDALARITDTAQRLLDSSDALYGNTTQGQTLREWVLSSMEGLPATKSYDAQILAALQALGGSVNVSVEVETVRVITEAINALSDADKAKLQQTQTILRTVEERLGRALTTQEANALVASAVISREITQTLGHDLSAAERAALVAGGSVARSIEEALGVTLTAAQIASLIQGGAVTQTVAQQLGVTLTAAQIASLQQSGAVAQTVAQYLGRTLSAADISALTVGGSVTQTVEQLLGRVLTDTERGGLVVSASVVGTVEQKLGRSLTDAERASLVESGTVSRLIGQTVSEATGAALVQSETVTRTVTQTVSETATISLFTALNNTTETILSSMNAQLVAVNTNLSSIYATVFGIASQNNTVKVTSSFKGGVGMSFAGGGHVVGPGTETSDDIPAWLSTNEWVINAAAARAAGHDTLAALNDNRPDQAAALLVARYGLSDVARYADGGPVGDIVPPSPARMIAPVSAIPRRSDDSAIVAELRRANKDLIARIDRLERAVVAAHSQSTTVVAAAIEETTDAVREGTKTADTAARGARWRPAA